VKLPKPSKVKRKSKKTRKDAESKAKKKDAEFRCKINQSVKADPKQMREAKAVRYLENTLSRTSTVEKMSPSSGQVTDSCIVFKETDGGKQ
jgi:hypothetical protein